MAARPGMDDRVEQVVDITQVSQLLKLGRQNNLVLLLQGDKVNIELAERVGVSHLAVSYPQVKSSFFLPKSTNSCVYYYLLICSGAIFG